MSNFLDVLNTIIQSQGYEHYSSDKAKVYCAYNLTVKQLKFLAESGGFFSEENKKIIKYYVKKLREKAVEYDTPNIVNDIDEFLSM